MSSRQPSNRFLTGAPLRVFAANAAPMVLVMSMSGLLNVTDAVFVGRYVGASGLAAVSLVFPAVMLTIALSTMASGGMSSLYARALGAGDTEAAAAAFARAHGLALALCAGLIAAFAALGAPMIRHLSAGDAGVATMAWRYLAILIAGTPVQFLLGLHADARRNEGGAALMALLSVGVTLANIALNYALIVLLHLGVAGAAIGTIIAQAAALALLAALRSGAPVPLSALAARRWTGGWRRIAALGAPLSLSFIGLALVSATVIVTLRVLNGPALLETLAAYGIVTRLIGFAFLPLMAIGLATQSVTGNNVGARLYHRSDAVLRIALVTAALYCAAMELAFQTLPLARLFVTDPATLAAAAPILRRMTLLYVTSGPVLILALYFQAIGQPLRAAALTLFKPFALQPLLIPLLAMAQGAPAIWYAVPLADAATAAIALAIALPALRLRPPGGGLGLTEERIP